MFIRKLILVAGIPLMTAAVASARPSAAEPTSPEAASAASTSCVLRQYKIRAVKPYTVQRNIAGHLVVSETLGAELTVEAQPGLTAEWLWLSLERHVGDMRTQVRMGDCPLDIDKVRVEVLSAGPGFTVRVIGPDRKSGDEVLRRAQLLVS